MDETTTTPPKWRKTEDIMKKHSEKFKKLKRRRLNLETFSKQATKRFDANSVDDTTTDGTLFRLMNHSQPPGHVASQTANLSFTNLMTLVNSPHSSQKLEPPSGPQELHVDWTLRSRLRIASTTPFPWNRKLKTCEEASGITGFVRCIDTNKDDSNINLDTSPNAQFHQCCLVWQHPSFPWINMYPRIGSKIAAGRSEVNLIPIKDKIFQTWLNAFRSLFHLVRSKQCPYFYFISNTFVCLFRASGINGYPEMNVTITPTSRGFRDLLKTEGIEFTMPLKIKINRHSKSPITSNDTSDTGYASIDLNDDEHLESLNTISDDEETDNWLREMEIGVDDIKKFNTTTSEARAIKEGSIDTSSESLVFIEGVETQALFNFLSNCKSIIPPTGSFAGVPPTLLSPVAFTEGSLTSLKVKEGIIRENNIAYHSMEILGPILPHMTHNLCELLQSSSINKFSIAFENIDASKALTESTSRYIDDANCPSLPGTPKTQSIFGKQNLVDCGLKTKILSKFCESDVKHYDLIKFSDSVFTCK